MTLLVKYDIIDIVRDILRICECGGTGRRTQKCGEWFNSTITLEEHIWVQLSSLALLTDINTKNQSCNFTGLKNEIINILLGRLMVGRRPLTPLIRVQILAKQPL